MKVHLVDGTYELFRHYFGAPSHITSEGYEIGATRAVLASMLSLLEQGATHIGIATDHTITSFRNELYEGYKDCLLYTSPSPRDGLLSRMPSSA